MNSACEKSDLLVFSHLRWDFVFQRPQHLMIRHAKHRRVFYFEEPVFGMTELPKLHLRKSIEDVHIVVPYLPVDVKAEQVQEFLKELVDELIFKEEVQDFTIWYYNPMSVSYTNHLKPSVAIFDCMDELSLFKGAPQYLLEREAELIQKADLMFTGGLSLFEAKKQRHNNIHAIPSSIDYQHFHRARQGLSEPADQINIPHPRIGFYGVIDERFNTHLLEIMANIRPEFQFIIIGPLAKIDQDSLPTASNIHYLGKKEYEELPLYLSGWDCAMMPFALNESTRYISPTKTPEFLAAGKPVVSTSINDVVHPYADARLIYIADHPEHFVECIEKAMNERAYDPEWLEKVDQFLEGDSWDFTFKKMVYLESKVKEQKDLKLAPVYKDTSFSEIGIV